ncbi:MAG: HdeA/HdeB family chaperone [Candidatus Rokuibacteriota bacterium]
MLTWVWAAVVLAGIALPVSAEASGGVPLRKLELNTFTCGDLAAVPHRMVREGILVYMNGYLDGARKEPTWDAEVAGKRIDEVMRLCSANPKSILFDAFNRAGSR